MVTDDAAWSTALADWFFREEFAGRPVFLYVDEETLDSIGRESGIAASDALGSLARAVRPRVRGRSPLESWIKDSVAWRRAGFAGPPPFLSILAITVLAATILDNPNDRSYYPRLNELLGLPGRSMPRYFDSDIQQLWACLNEWLDEVQHGRLGVATATNKLSPFPNVGWALSQTVLLPSDRAKLPFLFSALGVHPGQQVDGHLLVVGLRRSGLAGHGMSRRLAAVLDDPALTDRLAMTLASELARWDGTLRDEAGRRATQLLLTFHERSRAFGLAVRTPPDLAHLGLSLGGDAPVPLGNPADLQLIPIPVTASLLDGASLPAKLVDLSVEEHGVSHFHKPVRLVVPHVDVHLLTPNDGLARWVDVRPAELHRRHIVLVRTEIAQAAVAVMGSLGETVPRATSIKCPRGWLSYQFEPVRSQAIDGPLSVLSPRGTEVSTFDGGLPISARSRLFMSAGPPDVLLGLAGTDAVPTIDGEPAPTIDSPDRLRLAGRELTKGTHRIDVGGSRLTLRLVDEYAVGPTICSLAIALRAETSPTGTPWTIPVCFGAQPYDADHNQPVDILVRGASLELSEHACVQPGLDSVPHPQARFGGMHYALGDGRVAVRVFPSLPEWLLKLQPRPVPHLADLSSCVVGLPFVPTWFLRIARGRATVVCAGIPQPGRQPSDGEAVAAANEWDRVLPWLADATAEPGQSTAWATWLDSMIAAHRARRR